MEQKVKTLAVREIAPLSGAVIAGCLGLLVDVFALSFTEVLNLKYGFNQIRNVKWDLMSPLVSFASTFVAGGLVTFVLNQLMKKWPLAIRVTEEPSQNEAG